MNNSIQVFIIGKNDQLIEKIKEILNNNLEEVDIYFNTNQKNEKTFANKKTEYIITILHNIGMPTHLNGYQYVLEILKNDILKNCDYKMGDVYKYIGKKFHTKAKNVERSIRTATEICWHRGDYCFIEKIFGHSIDFEKNKPSNTELLFTVYEYISNHLVLL